MRLLGPASGSPGREMRLPELVLELYDVDVKGWLALARNDRIRWLRLR